MCLALRGEWGFGDLPRGDTGVVGAAQPPCAFPVPALMAAHCMQDRVLERLVHLRRIAFVWRLQHAAALATGERL